ncbi:MULTISPECIES: thioredoxin [unclassified Bradyrhizobium]|uniref:thioredoxin n=1 Tax=unclassified Bradyrhizobium TaxID=2631580 RepID=UPI00040CD523|nr:MULTISPECIES: thioredoxin [unclassified Bradyrhizobium]MCP3462065.1 thioredoxin [Bradyrhizobium sp. CCGUVB23]
MTIIDQGNGAAGQAAPDLIKDTTTQTFVKDVIEESKRQPVLIDFWAEWCGPCKQLTPVLEKAVKAAKGKVKLVKMNIDQHPAIPGQMGIQSIPAVIAFVNGQPADGFMGAVPESQVNAFIERLTKGVTAPGEVNVAEIVKEADAVLAEGDVAAAAQIYAEALSHDATNIAALAGLAKCYVASGAIEQAKQTLAMVPESKHGDAAVKAVQAAIDLAEQAESLGPVAELEQKVTANPLDHQARFDLATALNAQGDRAAATDQLLEIVKRDRKWNDDGARKQLIQFFEAWGGADDATVEGRKRLSTILFS